MPNLSPEQHTFRTYVHYDDGNASKPRLIAYPDSKAEPSAAEAAALRQHEEDEDIEFKLIVK